MMLLERVDGSLRDDGMACHFIDAIYDLLWSLYGNNRIWGKFVATGVILSDGKLGELMLNLCFFSSLFSHCSVYAMIPVHNMHPPPKLLLPHIGWSTIIRRRGGGALRNVPILVHWRLSLLQHLQS
jgi:hypothetical protein